MCLGNLKETQKNDEKTRKCKQKINPLTPQASLAIVMLLFCWCLFPLYLIIFILQTILYFGEIVYNYKKYRFYIVLQTILNGLFL